MEFNTNSTTTSCDLVSISISANTITMVQHVTSQQNLERRFLLIRHALTGTRESYMVPWGHIGLPSTDTKADVIKPTRQPA